MPGPSLYGFGSPLLMRGGATYCASESPELGLLKTAPTLSEYAARCPALCELSRKAPYSRSFLAAELQSFTSAYAQRPIHDNLHGMNMFHAFSLWVTIRTLRPRVVVESGVFRGQGTYFIRRAAGADARVFSLDPRPSSIELYHDPSPRTTYLRGEAFVDFAAIAWRQLVPSEDERASALLVLDDHMSALKRVLQAVEHGFRHLWYEDEGGVGSLRWLCSAARERALEYADNFGAVRENVTAAEDAANRRALLAYVRAYHPAVPIHNPCARAATHEARRLAEQREHRGACAVPLWSGVLREPSAALAQWQRANGTRTVTRHRRTVHWLQEHAGLYPPWIELRPRLADEQHARLLEGTTPQRLSRARRGDRVAGIKGAEKTFCAEHLGASRCSLPTLY